MQSIAHHYHDKKLEGALNLPHRILMTASCCPDRNDENPNFSKEDNTSFVVSEMKIIVLTQYHLVNSQTVWLSRADQRLKLSVGLSEFRIVRK